MYNINFNKIIELQIESVTFIHTCEVINLLMFNFQCDIRAE